jgi:ubiquinone/menaquinone biosynthesis C-methylase UbiE
MSFYEDRILPHMINLACGSKPARKQREKIVPRASGDVLELGIGSGLNLPHYDRKKVRRIWGLDPSEGMRKLAARRASESGLDVELIGLDHDAIPLDDHSVDSVLVTFTLCTIPDVGAALEEVRRVMKPGGRLYYCEHGQAPDENVQRWQRRLNGPWQRISGGCNMDRDIPSLLTGAGFTIEDDNRMYIPGLRMLSYNFWGAAY